MSEDESIGDMENIDEVFNAKDEQEKILFFFKREGEPKVEIDEDKPLNSRVGFREPLQVIFFPGGEATISSDGIFSEQLGFITVLNSKEIWENLLQNILKHTDAEIREGTEVEVKDYYAFYLYGFENKEDAIGSIQERYKSWISQLERALEQIKPGDPIEEGNKTMENEGVKKKSVGGNNG